MPDLFYGVIDAGAPNAYGLRTEAIKFKFKGADYAHQFGLAEYLAQGMQDPAVRIADLVDFTLDLDGTTPDRAVELLFDDTNTMIREGGEIYEAVGEAATLLEELVDCGEAFAAFLAMLA